MKKDMAYMKGEFGRFKGKDFERTIRERYPAYFGRLLKRCRLVDWDKLVDMVDEAEDRGIISEKERDEIFRIDLVVQGRIRSTGKPVVLAVEVSYSVYEKDIERAITRSRIFQKLFEEEVIPVVVGVEVKEEVEKIADDRGVLLIKADY